MSRMLVGAGVARPFVHRHTVPALQPNSFPARRIVHLRDSSAEASNFGPFFCTAGLLHLMQLGVNRERLCGGPDRIYD
jgi:hypothetical protein